MDLLKKFTKRDRNLSVGSSGYIAGEIPQISHLQIVQEDIAQPDDAKVNEMFESLLDKMGFEDSKRSTMMAMNIDYKWKMVTSQMQKEKSKGENKGDKDTPEFYAKQLGNSKHTNLKILSSLRISLTNQPLSWVQTFLSLGGLNSLIDMLKILHSKTNKKDEDAVEVELLKSIKALVNNKAGLRIAFQNPESLKSIALSTASENINSRRLALELLSVFCYLDPPVGQNAVLKSMDYLQEQMGDERRFQTFCANFEEYSGRHDVGTEKEVMEYLISNMIFVNAIISTPDDLEVRIHLCNQFYSNGLNRIFKNIKPSGNYLLNKQFDIFDNELEANYEELSEQHAGLKSSTKYPFLFIFYYILLILKKYSNIPKYWQLLDEVITQIVLDGKGIDPDFTAVYKISVTKIIEEFCNIEKLGKAEEALAIVQDKLQNLMKQKNDLEVEYKDSLNKIMELTKRLESKKHIPDAPESLSPVSIETSPKAAFIDSAAELNSNKSVPLAPSAPPPPPGVGVPPPPPPGIPGGPPPPPGSAPKSKLKPKKQYCPQVKLKQLQWEKIPDNSVESTVWMTMNEEKWENQVDFTQIESMFSMKNTAIIVSKMDFNGKERQKKDQKAIMLSRMKCSFYEIRKAILQMDQAVLTEQMVKQFLQYIPTAEEIGMLSVYKDDCSSLAKSDAFIVEMMKINRYEPRLRAMLFTYSYMDRYNNLTHDVDSVINAVRNIKNSQAFHKLLEVILLIGNYMNSGGFKSKAYGFRISNLNKLVDTKASDNKKTLLHFIVETVQEKLPEILVFRDDLQSVTSACKVSFQFVETEINDLRFFIKDIKNELENHYKEPSADPTDLYQSKMTEFIRKIDPGFITLEKNHEIMTELFSQIVQSFGEDPKKIQSEEFFGTFKTFIVSFDAALRDYSKEKTKNKGMPLAEVREIEKSKLSNSKKNLALNLSIKEDLNQADEDIGMMDDLLESLKHGNTMDKKIRIERRRKNSVISDQAMGLLEKLKNEGK